MESLGKTAIVLLVFGLWISAWTLSYGDEFERAAEKARAEGTTPYRTREEADVECAKLNMISVLHYVYFSDDRKSYGTVWSCGYKVIFEQSDDPPAIDQSGITSNQPFEDAATQTHGTEKAAEEAIRRIEHPVGVMRDNSLTAHYDEFIKDLYGDGATVSNLSSIPLLPNPFETKADREVLQEECNERNQDAINEINARIDMLRQSEPDLGSGPQVDVGSCASRLKKVAGNFLCCTTFLNVAPFWEERSCLELKKLYLQKSCQCQSRGSFTADAALQDSVLEMYASIREMRSEAISQGIDNEYIGDYVSEASEAIDCINDNSLGLLNSIDDSLTSIIPR